MMRKVFWSSYGIVSLFTFAVIASDPANVCTPSERQYDACVTPAVQVFKGTIGAATWPVYWTWTAVDAARQITGSRPRVAADT